MPLPFILGAAAVIAGAFGVNSHIKAKEKRDTAEKTYKRSESKQKDSIKELSDHESITTTALENVGKARLKVASTSIKKFLTAYQQLDKLNHKGIAFGDIGLDKTNSEIIEMQKISADAADVISIGISSLGGGALAAYGAYAGVMALGTASTGTAIATLSGAAATNATLAAIGGGSLAAGGGGMALGSAVMGLAVAGPAILISGLISDSNAEEALTEAEEFRQKVNVACEERELRVIELKAIQTRCSEFNLVLQNACIRLNPHVIRLESMVMTLEPSAVLSEDQLKLVHTTFSLAKFVKNLLEVPLFDEKTMEPTAAGEEIIQLVGGELEKQVDVVTAFTNRHILHSV